MLWRITFCNSPSVIATQHVFRKQFNIASAGRVPDQKSIVQWVDTFIDTGSVQKSKPGPSRTTRTPENVERIRLAVLKSPRRSARKHATALSISDCTVRRILHEDLNFHLYKLAVVQKLNPCNFVSHKNACEALIVNLPHNSVMFFSDKAHFHQSEYVNKQNLQYWSFMNLQELHEKPLHTEHVTVWCALSRIGIMGQWFFEGNNKTVTVTSKHYVKMIKEFFFPNSMKWM